MVSDAVTVAREEASPSLEGPRRALPAILPVAMAIVSSVSLLLLVQTSGMTTTGYEVKRLEQEREDWQQANYQLAAEVAYLKSLPRIEKEATSRLRMVPATDYLFVSVAKSPEVSGDGDPPLVQTKRPTVGRDDGWSQELLDWLGSALGLRDR
ncbi:MAG: hypothetical protein HYX94_10810 [Chloroflexi bacterium]|nr:hypothetical protein [Chloroflexota bacterium]